MQLLPPQASYLRPQLLTHPTKLLQDPWPAARCSQSVAADGKGSIYMQGGSFYKPDGSGLASHDDLWCLDTRSRKWECLGSSGKQGGPSARNAGVMVAAAPQTLVHHGGWLPFKVSYTDTWVLQT